MTQSYSEQQENFGLIPPHWCRVIPSDLVILGRDIETDEEIHIADVARCAGLYCLGDTRKGKTKGVIVPVIIQDIQNEHSVVFLTPDREAINDVLARIPENRLQDVLLIQPGQMTHPVGLNVLARTEKPIDLDVDRLMDIIKRLWGYESDNPSWGPRLQQVLRAAIFVGITNSLTMAELIYLLKVPQFRQRMTATVPDSGIGHYVKFFWEEDFAQLYKEKKGEVVGSVTNKLYDMLMIQEVVNVVGQKTTTLNFTEMIARNKIILIHLAKEHVGRDGMKFLGTIFLAEFMKAAFSRAPGIPNRPFVTLAIDEFQNYASSEFVENLPMIGKHDIAVVLCNQFFKQLEPDLLGAVKQLGTQITFGVSNPDDARERAWLYKRAPLPEYREQEKKLPVTRPINYIVNGGIANTSETVISFAKRWEDVVREAGEHIREGVRGGDTKVVTDWRGRSKTIHTEARFYSNRESIEHIREGLDLINGLLYEVMRREQTERESNPCLVVPIELVQWMAEEFELPFFGGEAYQNMTALIEMFPEEQKALYNNLWLVPDNTFDQALGDFAQEAYRQFYTAISSMLGRFRASVDIEFRGDDDDNQTKHKQYDYFQKSDLETVFRHCPLDWFPQEVVNTFEWERGKHYPLKYAPHAPNDTSDLSYSVPGWRLVTGQEADWIHIPSVRQKMDSMFAELREAFESFVRELREVMQALASSPLLRGSGEYERVEVSRRSVADMVNEMAGELVDLPNRVCYVRLGTDEESKKPKMVTLPLTGGVDAGELALRVEQVQAQTTQYGTPSDLIEEALQRRRVQYGISSLPVQQPQTREHTKDTHQEPQTEQETAGVSSPEDEKQATPTLSSSSHPLVSISQETLPDTYLELLYWFSNLTLKQAVKLVGLVSQTKDELTKINKREQSKINRLIGQGLVETVEPEATKFLSAGGRAPLVYRLKKAGYDKLHKEKGYKPIQHGDFSSHAFKVNEVAIALLQGLKETSYTLVDFTHEKQFRQKPIALGNQGLEPDSWLSFMVNGQSQSVFLEVDLKSESSGKLKDKIRRYLQAIEKKAHPGFTAQLVRIVFINPNGKEADTDRLARIIEETIEQKDSPYFLVASCTLEDIAPLYLLTGSLYKKPFDAAVYSLLT